MVAVDVAMMAGAEIDAARAGDHEAFAALVRPMIPSAYRLAISLLQDGREAEDAVQDATLRAWQKLSGLRDPGALEPWFLRIVANRCRELRRRGWWRVQRGDLPERGGEEHDAAVVAGEDLRRALGRLNHDQRTVLSLHFYLDLPLEEVGRVVGVPLGTVKSRLNRALAKLRPLLGEDQEVRA
jgi:RNA polymerase sigma-70 factor (ECF subfamily)